MDKRISGHISIFSIIIFTTIIIVSSTRAGAVEITTLSITDRLNSDLSMRETIIIHIANNSEGEFKLALPDLAYDILYDGSEVALENLSSMLECDDCTGNISYSFPNIVKNDSENYTFFRKIDMPINVSDLDYIIVLPENYTLFSRDDLSQSLIPMIALIQDYRTFEWHYISPQFPKEFAVRYRQVPKRSFDLSGYFVYMIIIVVMLAVLLIGIYLGHKIRRMRSKKKKVDFNFKDI